MATHLRVEDVLSAYQTGWFPMADPDGEIYWYEPRLRGIIELDALKVSRSLRRTIAKHTFETRINTAFREVMMQCARRDDTWISDEIIRVYSALHERGLAHSVESFHNDTLVGGLYGVALGGAFFGESMFSTMADASKVALVALVGRMRERGFVLLDTQFLTEHLQSMGAIEIPRDAYAARLAAALTINVTFA